MVLLQSGPNEVVDFFIIYNISIVNFLFYRKFSPQIEKVHFPSFSASKILVFLTGCGTNFFLIPLQFTICLHYPLFCIHSLLICWKMQYTILFLNDSLRNINFITINIFRDIFIILYSFLVSTQIIFSGKQNVVINNPDYWCHMLQQNFATKKI